MRLRRGFTLIELLVSIAIMGLLIALLVPNINRSLQKNQIAEDADLFKSKLEETRLMAGSTQQGNVTIAYYGLYLKPGSGSQSFYIIQISKDFSVDTSECSVINIEKQITAGNGACIVEEVALAGKINNPDNETRRILAFKVPQQQIVEIDSVGASGLREVYPLNYPDNKFAEITSSNTNKKANVKIDQYSGKVTVEYKTN